MFLNSKIAPTGGDKPSRSHLSRPVIAMQIGHGLHWERTIAKHLPELRAEGYEVSCPVGVELAIAREVTEARLALMPDSWPGEIFYVNPVSPYQMDAKTEAQLNRLVRKYSVNAVIVSVPPEAHFMYARWALNNRLNLFLDKPVTTRPDAITSLSAARGILSDFDELNATYGEAQRHGPICAMLNAQRPFIPAFAKIFDSVKDVREATGQVVTNITACHADGQMRVGGELVEVGYHGYSAGNGKLSHSAYHLKDVVARLLKIGTWAHARPDYLLVHSSLRQPDALAMAMPQANWVKIFGNGHASLDGYCDDELVTLGRRMGEVDAHVSIEAIRNGAVMTNVNLHLQHDTVSARSTLATPLNWYKKSGRMKRDLWHLDQGPMQSLRLETLQAEDKHDRPDAKGDQLGDPNHMQLARVVNTTMVPGAERFSCFSGATLAGETGEHLLSERAKRASLAEFVACAAGRLPVSQLTSDLSIHRLGVSLMAAAYESHIRRGADRMGAGVVRVDWSE